MSVSDDQPTTKPGLLARILRRPVSAPARRVLAVAAVAVCAFLVLVVVPGYVALQPAFLQRYADMRAPYRTWRTSVHASVACDSCHVPRDAGSRAAYAARMVGQFYATLLGAPRRFDGLRTPTNAACSACHIDQRTVSPSGDLNIPHRAHVGVLKLACVRCHQYLVHEKSPEGRHTPTMAACLKCHDGRQAKSACSACHTDKAAPATHQTPAWLVAHAGHRSDRACERCHKWTSGWCAHCHASRPTSHTADWRTVHGRSVARHRNCEACHEARFCVRCHGERPALNLDRGLALVR